MGRCLIVVILYKKNIFDFGLLFIIYVLRISICPMIYEMHAHAFDDLYLLF
mgnify:CR=1 FL=1